MSYIRALIESHGGDAEFVRLTGVTDRSLRNWRLNGMAKAESRYLTAVLEHVNREARESHPKVIPRALMEPLDVVNGCIVNGGGFDAVVAKTGIPATVLRKYASRGSLRGTDPIDHARGLAALGRIKVDTLIES